MALVPQPVVIPPTGTLGDETDDGTNEVFLNEEESQLLDETEQPSSPSPKGTVSKSSKKMSSAKISLKNAPYTFRQKGDDVIICVLYKIFALTEVSNTEQTFTVHVGEEMAVFISEEEYVRFMEDPKEFEPDYMPETFPYNGTEWEWDDYLKTSQGHPYYMRQLSKAANHDPDFGDRCFVWRQRMAKITFNEPFELENFPFDVQTLTMIFQFHTYKHDPTVTFKIKPLYGGAAYSFGFVEPQGEYKVLRDYKKFEVRGTPWMGDSQVRCTFVIRRNWTFYFWKVAFVLSIISLTAIVALMVFDSFLDQSAHLSTILLTEVAYLYIVSTYMPLLSYLSLMDWFVNFNIGFVFLIFCEIAIVELTGGADGANTRVGSDDSMSVGDLMLTVNIMLWVAINIFFFYLAVSAYHNETKKIVDEYGASTYKAVKEARAKKKAEAKKPQKKEEKKNPNVYINGKKVD